MGRLALLIGNQTFAQPEQFPPLRTPANDVVDLAEILQKQGRFDRVEQLIDEDSAVVKERIEAFYRQAKQGDLTLLYYSGHGFKNPAGRLWLVAQDTQTDRLWTTGIDDEFIRNVKNDSGARHHLIMLDCCFSGAFVDGGVKSGEEPLVLERLSGATTAVLTSSSRIQFSFEEQSRNSLFTQYVLEGVRTGQADQDGDGKISVDELFNYVKPLVQRKRPNQTPVKQMSATIDTIYFARLPPQPRHLDDVFKMLATGQKQYEANEELLTPAQVRRIRTHLSILKSRLTEQQLSLILKSVLSHQNAVQTWVESDSRCLPILRSIWRDRSLPVSMREQAVIALGKLEDTVAYEELITEMEQATRGNFKQRVEETAVFRLHSQEKRPLAPWYWVPVQVKGAILRWHDESQHFIWPLTRTAFVYSLGLGVLLYGIEATILSSESLEPALLRPLVAFLIAFWVFIVCSVQTTVRELSPLLQVSAVTLSGASTGCIPFVLWSGDLFGFAVGAILGFTIGYARQRTKRTDQNNIIYLGASSLFALLACSLVVLPETDLGITFVDVVFCQAEPLPRLFQALFSGDWSLIVQPFPENGIKSLIIMLLLTLLLSWRILWFTRNKTTNN